MLSEIKKADLNAPRYRPARLSVLDKNFYKSFKTIYPEYKNMKDKEITEIIYAFNELLAENIIINRDGIELPEGLGYCFIGTCKSPKKQNTDFYNSKKLSKRIKHRNFESDNYLAKIFYSNYANKYKYKHRELWQFKGHKDLRSKIASFYPANWKMYVQVESFQMINKLFKKHIARNHFKNKLEQDLLSYNEFDMN